MARRKARPAERRKTATTIIEPDSVDLLDGDGDGGELVAVSGVCLDVWEGAASTFLPMLKKDMPLVARRKAVRGITKEACLLADKLYAVMGETLYEIRENRYWKKWSYDEIELDGAKTKTKYRSFEEYLEKECDVKRRTAYYYIKVYEKLIVELGIPPHVIRTVEWSKAKELVPFMNKDNWKELIKVAKDKTVRGLRSYLTELKGEGAVESSTPSTDLTKRMNFNLSVEQYDNIQLAFTIASKIAESSSQGNLLDLICTSYIAESPDDLAGTEGLLVQLDQVIRSVERNFGIKLELVADDEELSTASSHEEVKEFLDEEEEEEMAAEASV